MIENNENFEVCRKCGGKCCKFMPCMLFPGEVRKMYGIKEFTYDNMLEILKKKEVIIDYWEGDICDCINEEDHPYFYKKYKPNDRLSSYFIRFRTIDETGDYLVYPAWEGQCINLTNTGCKFNWDNRPICGKALIPNDKGLCDSKFNKQNYALSWLKYENILEDIAIGYGRKSNYGFESFINEYFGYSNYNFGFKLYRFQ